MGGVTLFVYVVVSFCTSNKKSNGGTPWRSAGVRPPWHPAQYFSRIGIAALQGLFEPGGAVTPLPPVPAAVPCPLPPGPPDVALEVVLPTAPASPSPGPP